MAWEALFTKWRVLVTIGNNLNPGHIEIINTLHYFHFDENVELFLYTYRKNASKRSKHLLQETKTNLKWQWNKAAGRRMPQEGIS